MIKEAIINHVTVRAFSRISNRDDVAKLLFTARMYRLGVTIALEYLEKNIPMKDCMFKIKRFVPNQKYAHACYERAREMYKSAKRKGKKVKQLRQWLMFESIGDRLDRGNRNIRLSSPNEVEVVVFTKNYSIERVRVPIKPLKTHTEIIEELYELGSSKLLGYNARCIIRDYSRDKALVEFQFIVPLELYLKYRRLYDKPRGLNIGGIDWNSDRANLAVVSPKGELLDHKTWWFPETTSHGYPRTARRTKQSQILSEIMDYCYHHGCSVVVFEDPDTIKTRRYTKNATANRKITRWTKREASQMFILKALRYGLKPFFANPAYTSKLAEVIAKELGLDRHTTSAYILALEYLGLKPKEIYQNLQRP
ncbi:MAG: hypothetical protein DRO40_12985 [Thermoprotei archaeon]|nr:MAG: hypothetical protein DRO40_12985 [Thermoprotei archaeon]